MEKRPSAAALALFCCCLAGLLLAGVPPAGALTSPTCEEARLLWENAPNPAALGPIGQYWNLICTRAHPLPCHNRLPQSP